MAIYDKTALGKKAREYGFSRDTFEKMSRLVEVLRLLNSSNECEAHLALKGGSAINIVIFNLPRLSVDIDLDFCGDTNKEETAAKRGRITELLRKFMAAEGYTLKDKSKHTHALDSFVYSYTNAAGNADNIKVEINYLQRCHVLPTVKLMPKTDAFPSPFAIHTINPIEIFAGKIVALADRAATRDLFDFCNMVHFSLFDEKEFALLRKCAVFYLTVSGDTMAKGITFEKLSDITPRTVRMDLNPMLRNRDFFDLDAAKEKMSTAFAELSTPDEREATFLKRFHRGYYEPQLLFDDEEILSRIKNHPMAVWRIQRIHGERDGQSRYSRQSFP
jgi:predicted nucleotidyltransferase component of viral defense system